MRLPPLLMLLPLTPLMEGCAYADAIHDYAASDRLVYDNRQPLGDQSFIVTYAPLGSTTPPEESVARTSADGRFSYRFFGEKWGYISLFGFIPLGSPNRKPPRLDQVYLSFEREPGVWAQVELPLTIAQQPEQGQIELGDVTISSPGHSRNPLD